MPYPKYLEQCLTKYNGTYIGSKYINIKHWDNLKDDGTFFIDVTKGSELTFSHIGYVEIKLIAKNEMFVYLTKDILKLSEIIVESGLVLILTLIL